MSVKTELDKIVSNLRDARKAILGRGGEISSTAGLKDLPNAIFNIPADASLAFQEDSSLAYEKIVPSNAEEYAAVMKIGGLSMPNNNLCIADGYHEIKDEWVYNIDLGELEAGEYYFKTEGSDLHVARITFDGNAHFYSEVNGNLHQFANTLEVYEKSHIVIELWSYKSDTDPATPEYETASLLNGTITGIMLCKESDADKSYKPYSRTSNLCRADGHYDLTSRPATMDGQHIPLDLGVLDVGIYQLQWYGDISYLYSISIDGDVMRREYYDFPSNYIILEVQAKSQITASLQSEWYWHGHEGGAAGLLF